MATLKTNLKKIIKCPNDFIPKQQDVRMWSHVLPLDSFTHNADSHTHTLPNHNLIT